MKKLYIGTNTKMYKTIEQTVDFISSLSRLTAEIGEAQAEIFVIPSFTTLESANKIKGHISLGAQNMNWLDEGQMTGEISPLMLREVGVKVVEIGHSERRHVLGEDDEMENRKVTAAAKHGFTPLLCIGETDTQKKYGVADEVLRMQLKIGLHGLDAAAAKNLWIAYEPVWAIGVNGVPADSDYVDERHQAIRAVLIEIFGEEAGRAVPILFGGSVNNTNSLEYIRLAEVDGLFIGRSAWDAENFKKIIDSVLPVFQQKQG